MARRTNSGRLCLMRTTATWVLRGLWLLLPLTVGQAVEQALEGAGDSVTRTMVIGLWILWAIGTISVSVPLPVSLTSVRILSPAVVVLAGWALAIDGLSGLSMIALAHAMIKLQSANAP